MIWSRRSWLALATLAGFMSVAVGAFAAHGVADPKVQELLRTGSQYAFMHAMATIACATFMEIGAARARFAAPFFLVGIVLFSGSLYALAAGAPRVVGAITPVGGLAFLAGWAVLAWSARGIDPAR